jgi:hypothetical protein
VQAGRQELDQCAVPDPGEPGWWWSTGMEG